MIGCTQGEYEGHLVLVALVGPNRAALRHFRQRAHNLVALGLHRRKEVLRALSAMLRKRNGGTN